MKLFNMLIDCVVSFIVITLFVYSAFVGVAEAITLQWGHGEPATVTGYNVYYQPADQSAGPFKAIVNGGDTFTVTISNDNFKPGVVNDFWATAVNEVGESDPTEKIQWTRSGNDNGEENGPDTVYILPGKPSQIVIINEK